jgi:phosphate transport system permease protein
MMEAGTPSLQAQLSRSPGQRRRRLTNRVMEGLSTLAAGLAVAVLGIVIVSVIVKGASALNFDFLTTDPSPLSPGGGGIAPAIVGTVILVVLAAAMAVPTGILIAIYTSQFARPRVATAVQFALDILNGVPTIVVGIFIFGVLVVGGPQSGWAGSIGLAIVMLPVVARSAQEVLALVPRSLHEAAVALGIRRWRVVLRVILPTAIGGLITGAILGVARAAGETAPLLFTSSIFANTVTTDPSSALPNIPVTIFQLSEAPSPQEHAQAWAAALVLIFLVLLLSVVARTFYERSRRRIRG